MGGTVAQSTKGWPPDSTLDADDADFNDASGLFDTPDARWYTCDKCGQLFPSFDTIIDAITGARLCIAGPFDADDNPDNDPRLTGNFLARVYSGEEEITE